MILFRNILSAVLFFGATQTAFALPIAEVAPFPEPSAKVQLEYYSLMNKEMYDICIENAGDNFQQCQKDEYENINSLIQQFNECWIETNDFYPGQTPELINEICENMVGFNPHNYPEEDLHDDIQSVCTERHQAEVDSCWESYPQVSGWGTQKATF
jgi:hypothetical protein